MAYEAWYPRFFGLAALALASALWAAPAGAKPKVVSVDMCADQLVLSLADPDQVLSLSPTALRPAISPLSDRAQAWGVATNGRTAEEVVREKPDVVFTGMWSGRSFKALSALGYRVVWFPPARNIDDAVAQIRRAGTALDQTARAEQVVAAVARARERARLAAPAVAPEAVLYLPGGFSFGRRTLFTDMLHAAGIRNLMEDRPGDMVAVDLEHLVVARPDLILANDQDADGAPREATALMRHPALRRAAPGARRVLFPSRLWMCAGEQTAMALDYLTDHVLPALNEPGP